MLLKMFELITQGCEGILDRKRCEAWTQYTVYSILMMKFNGGSVKEQLYIRFHYRRIDRYGLNISL